MYSINHGLAWILTGNLAVPAILIAFFVACATIIIYNYKEFHRGNKRALQLRLTALDSVIKAESTDDAHRSFAASFDDIDAAMGRFDGSPGLVHAWTEYSQTIVGHDEEVLKATTRPYEYFLHLGDDTRVLAWWANIFVALGLTFTFLGIIAALTQTTDNMRSAGANSAGMFVHSAEFVKRHQRSPDSELSVFGMEKTRETIRLAKMNLAVHGLSGSIVKTNSYYDDAPFGAEPPLVGGFDFVMANPPFNVSGVDKTKLKTVTDQGVERVKPRFPFGLPTTDNANTIWMSQFYSALNAKGRAGFVMANSGSDARGSELDIRKKLIESGAVDVIVSVGPNFFFTVTLPCTLWFFDKGKLGGAREDEVLFIDARHIFRQIDRAHRDFTEAQVEFIANIVRLWRGREPELAFGSTGLLREQLDGLDAYADVAGLCRSVSRAEIAAQGWSLNPGRYVGVAAGEADGGDFREKLEALQEELERLERIVT